jgi:hypothetical protein
LEAHNRRRRQARAGLKDTAPFGLLVPVQLSRGARPEPHIDSGHNGRLSLALSLVYQASASRRFGFYKLQFL